MLIKRDLNKLDMKSSLLLRKHLFTAFHLEAIFVSIWLMGSGNLWKINLAQADPQKFATIIAVQSIYFIRYTYANYILRKGTYMMSALQKIPWIEPIFALIMFNIIHIGGAIGSVYFSGESMLQLTFGFATYCIGTAIVVISENQRKKWKQKSENQGKLYTEGLFRYSMHINYFGEWLVISSYAFLVFSGQWWFLIVVIVDFFDLYAENIPRLDKYLQQKYGEAFEQYRANTKKFIPFII
jgi:steroid 5-alpha reductase family enzyme